MPVKNNGKREQEWVGKALDLSEGPSILKRKSKVKRFG